MSRTISALIYMVRVTMLIQDSDYDGKRQGNRVVSLGEIPYFDPLSKSRRQALAEGV